MNLADNWSHKCAMHSVEARCIAHFISAPRKPNFGNKARSGYNVERCFRRVYELTNFDLTSQPNISLWEHSPIVA